MDLSTNGDLRKLGGCTPQVAKQPLRDMKLQEKEDEKKSKLEN